MKNGFVKVAATTPEIKVADCAYNGGQIIAQALKLAEEGCKLIAFPELCITGYTCGDLFLQEPLLRGAMEELGHIASETKQCDSLIVVGLPIMHIGRLYNVAAVIKAGQVLGLVPKSRIPNYSEFYEGRHFAYGEECRSTQLLPFQQDPVPFQTRLLFACSNMPDFCLAVEICEDLWMPIPPSSFHAMAGATLIMQ